MKYRIVNNQAVGVNLPYQTPATKNLNRKDHIWVQVVGEEGPTQWKCCLCGAMTKQLEPPTTPTPPNWHPDCYERVTDEERRMVSSRR